MAAGGFKPQSSRLTVLQAESPMFYRKKPRPTKLFDMGE